MNQQVRQVRFSVRGLALIAAGVAMLHLVVAGRPSAAQKPKPTDDAGTVAPEQPAKDSPRMMDLSALDCATCHTCKAPRRVSDRTGTRAGVRRATGLSLLSKV